MTVPFSRRGYPGAAVAGVALLTAGAALLGGCASDVPGDAVAAAPAANRHITAQLGSLLPDPGQFPARYTTVVLPPEQAAQAAADLNGVGRAAAVQPAECAPPDQPVGADRTAVTVGTDNEARATITVELTRTDEPLSAWRNQLRQCGSVRVTKAGAATTVATILDAPPPVDADDTMAFRRTVTPDVGGAGLTSTMQTLAGQLGDVRIIVTYMTFGAGKVDTSTLDSVFTATVMKVRKG
ncbi:sensor domain-containing protein [Nocardia arthritidis]|uniref:sensor domain-containing protein n=1 Tax=Nocardia arthritidis TaxID=228602 RepID=UPI001EEA8FFE|nr:sensor domain-containing protein [Nocardia arthritidis]